MTCGKARIGNAAHNPNNLKHWRNWPSDDWVLIGYERWYQRPRGIRSSSRPFYATPNPSVHRPPCPAPTGYWHVCYNHNGRQTWQQWVGAPLVDVDEDQRYLKGGRSGPKGNFHCKGVDKGLGKGIGKGT